MDVGVPQFRFLILSAVCLSEPWFAQNRSQSIPMQDNLGRIFPLSHPFHAATSQCRQTRRWRHTDQYFRSWEHYLSAYGVPPTLYHLLHTFSFPSCAIPMDLGSKPPLGFVASCGKSKTSGCSQLSRFPKPLKRFRRRKISAHCA